MSAGVAGCESSCSSYLESHVLTLFSNDSFHCLFCHGYEERGGDSVGLLAAGLFDSAAIISHVSGMALNLAKKLTIYTNGNDEIAAEVAKSAQIVAFQTRVTVEKRVIKSLKMVALWEASDVLVTLDDGTEVKETFLVSCTILTTPVFLVTVLLAGESNVYF